MMGLQIMGIDIFAEIYRVVLLIHKELNTVLTSEVLSFNMYWHNSPGSNQMVTYS